MSIELDMTELRALVADMGKAPARLIERVDPILKRGAQNIKTAMVADAKGSDYFKSLARTISYDRTAGRLGLGAALGMTSYEIGPDKDRGGALGNIAYFGGANGGGGTLDIDGPLKAEAPRVEKFLSDLAGRSALDL